jgi:hypothetical protein
VVRVPKRLAVVVAVSAAAAVGLPGPAAPVPALAPAVAGAAKKPGPIDRAVQRLQAAQNEDGGFGKEPGARSDPVTSLWATLALAAAGINPNDQPGTGTTAFEYVSDEGRGWRRFRGTGDMAAFALVMRASGPGATPAQVSTTGELLKREHSGGGFAETPGGLPELRATALATLALLHDPAQQRRRIETAAAITRATGWLKKAFSRTGWGPTARARPRPDTTGLAMQALLAVDPDDPETRELLDQVTPWLTRNVNADGGLGASDLRESDPRATAWAMQGIVANRQDPKTFATNLDNRTPKQYLEKQQRTDGGFGDTLTTALVLPGFNATGFSLDPVAMGSPRASRNAGGEKVDNGAGTGGSGGSDSQSGAQAGQNGDDGAPGNDDGDEDTSDGGTPSGGGGGGGTPPSGAPDAPSAPAPTATPAPTPTPTPPPAAPPDPPKPADDTVAAAGGNGDEEDDETPPGAATKQVNGVVVGARAAAASAAPGVAAGAGDTGDRGTAVLGGLIVALVLVGTQLERRRPRRIVS